MNRWLLALPLLAACASAALLAGCATTPRAPAVPPGEPEPLPAGTWVELRFGWRPGLAAAVETVHARSSPGPGGGPERQELRMRSRLSVEAVPEGVAVRTDDVRHRGLERPSPTGLELLAEELPAPYLRIAPSGALLAVEPRDAAAVELRDALVTLSHVSPIPAAFREAILDRLKPPAVVVDARAAWDRLVGLWAGASLEAGRTYAARDLVSIDLLADLPLEVEVRMRVLGRVACGPGETERRCVALELTRTPDPAATTGVVPFLGRLFGDRGGEPRLAYEERSTLITEPSGLVPHRLETRRRLAVSFGANGEETYERLDERTTVFDYAALNAGAVSSAGTRSSSQHAASSR